MWSLASSQAAAPLPHPLRRDDQGALPVSTEATSLPHPTGKLGHAPPSRPPWGWYRVSFPMLPQAPEGSYQLSSGAASPRGALPGQGGTVCVTQGWSVHQERCPGQLRCQGWLMGPGLRALLGLRTWRHSSPIRHRHGAGKSVLRAGCSAGARGAGLHLRANACLPRHLPPSFPTCVLREVLQSWPSKNPPWSQMQLILGKNLSLADQRKELYLHIHIFLIYIPVCWRYSFSPSAQPATSSCKFPYFFQGFLWGTAIYSPNFILICYLTPIMLP